MRERPQCLRTDQLVFLILYLHKRHILSMDHLVQCVVHIAGNLVVQYSGCSFPKAFTTTGRPRGKAFSNSQSLFCSSTWGFISGAAISVAGFFFFLKMRNKRFIAAWRLDGGTVDHVEHVVLSGVGPSVLDWSTSRGGSRRTRRERVERCSYLLRQREPGQSADTLPRHAVQLARQHG